MKASRPVHQELLPGLHRFADTCNVYLVCDAAESLAIDFGSGAWVPMAEKLGLPPVRRVYLTHHHADQCSGLLDYPADRFEVHASAEEKNLLSEQGVRALRQAIGGTDWFPRTSYQPLLRGFPEGRICYDLTGFCDHYWLDRRLRFLSTPGHGAHAISLIVDHNGKQLVFCGDAAFAGAKIYEPFHLEWDHWTGTGALAAAEGVKRLAGLGIDLLLPSHGPVISKRPRQMLQLLARRLAALADAKGSICPGEKDAYITPRRFLPGGTKEILRGLYWFHNGGYLLVSETGEGFVTDPSGDLKTLEALLRKLPGVRITAHAITHIHGDHMNSAELVRKRYGSKLWLHPWVASMLQRGCRGDIPFLTKEPLLYDELWPEEGEWQWNEFTFRIAPMPGQTWWHCGFMTDVAGRRVLFGGDTFQPASRWNGTGGFCSINGCRFREGFAATAEKILSWKPDVIVNGHGTWRSFKPSYFRKVLRWAVRAERAVADLCPTGDLETDYYLHPISKNH